MTRKILSLILIILFIAACSTQDTSEKKPEVTPAITKDNKISVLNPTPPSSMVDRIPLTPRLDTLEGKTIFLVDIGWGGEQAAPSIYREIKDWFAKNMPSVKIETRKTKGFFTEEQPELIKEIGEKGDAAMFGIAG
ncbi:MAG: hypothetical protein JW927_08725 [Deltaproteobacteria bacterium]|nr:hypothetical protein [Deltaproteobacteria bacterium]